MMQRCVEMIIFSALLLIEGETSELKHKQTSLSSHVCSVCAVGQCAQGRFAQKLLNDLMENYSNALRPVDDTDKTLNVTLQVTLSQIKDMVSVHARAHTRTRDIIHTPI